MGIDPRERETIAVDGKLLRESYEAINDDTSVDSHPVIMLVSAYIVERGLILEPYEVDSETNKITAFNIYRAYGFDNRVKAQHLAGFGLKLIKDLFRMKQPP